MAEIDKPAASPSDEKPKAGIFERAFDSAVEKIDQKHPWYELPEPLGLTELIGVRNTLRQENLKDTSRLQAIDPAQPPPPDARKRHLEHRPAGRGALTRRRARCTSERLQRRPPNLADPGQLLSDLSYEELKLVESLARFGFFAGQV